MEGIRKSMLHPPVLGQKSFGVGSSPWNPKGIERLIEVDQLEVYGAAVAMPQIARSKELR